MIFQKEETYSLNTSHYYLVDGSKTQRTGSDMVKKKISVFFSHTALLKYPACPGFQKQGEDFGLTQTDRRTQSQDLIYCRLSFLEERFLRQVVCLNNGSLSGYIFPLLNGMQLPQLRVWWTVGEQMLNQMGRLHTKSQNPLGKSCKNLWCCTDVGTWTQMSPWFGAR